MLKFFLSYLVYLNFAIRRSYMFLNSLIRKFVIRRKKFKPVETLDKCTCNNFVTVKCCYYRHVVNAMASSQKNVADDPIILDRRNVTRFSRLVVLVFIVLIGHPHTISTTRVTYLRSFHTNRIT
ncbi:uncharacterized protein LOC143147670 isoform X1 [Ptiloglossa arizonensis]|uniref:uncharacterized protein LOC143147670 isoform X1 n=2 Tax=Ptiloglossa arizonensis TaxID=3350558 RepID=UPI003F9FBEF5